MTTDNTTKNSASTATFVPPLMTGDDAADLVHVLEIARIQEVFSRYIRGIDRVDVELMRSVFWEEAHDNHGSYIGPFEGFIEGALPYGAMALPIYHLTSPVHPIFRTSTQAKAETYFHFAVVTEGALPHPSPDGDQETSETGQLLGHLCGRYQDLFEKRSNEWRILSRKVNYDWAHVEPYRAGWEFFQIPENRGAPAPHDSSYAEGW